MGFETTVLVLTWVAILLLALVAAGMMRRVHSASTAVRPAFPSGQQDDLGLPPGTAAPDFARLSSAMTGLSLLLFLDGTCGVCPDVLAAASDLLAGASPPFTVSALFSGEAPDNAAPGVTIFAEESETFEKYQVTAVPFAVVVGQSGRVHTAQVVGSPSALGELTDRIAGPAAGGRQVNLNGGPL